MNKLLVSFITHENKSLLLLFILGIILRCIYTYYIYNIDGTSNWADDWEYLSMGKQIADGNWNPKEENALFMVVGPVIPIVVALFKLTFIDPVIPFFIYNIVVTSLLIPVLYLLGKELINRKLGKTLAIWALFFIEAYKYSPHILKEPTLFLFVPLTLLFIVKAIKCEYRRFSNIIFSAISFSLLIHTDERFLVYFPVLTLFILLIKPLTKSAFVKSASLWIFVVFLLMLPWGIRNYVVFDQVVILTPRTTAITSKLWGDNLAGSAAHFSDEQSKHQLNEIQLNNARLFAKKYNIYPRGYGKIEARLRAFLNFWQPTYFRATYIQYGFRPMKWSLRHNVASILFYGIFLPFYVVGILLLIKRKDYSALGLASIPIVHSLLHAYMVWPLERYRSPVTFIVVLIGIWVISEISENLKKRYNRLGKCRERVLGLLSGARRTSSAEKEDGWQHFTEANV